MANKLTKAQEKEIDKMICYFGSLDQLKEESLFFTGLLKLKTLHDSKFANKQNDEVKG